MQDSNTEQMIFGVGAAAGLPVAGLHAGAGRPDLHRHAAGRRLRPQAAGVPQGAATWSRWRSRGWACCATRWCRDKATAGRLVMGSVFSPAVAAGGKMVYWQCPGRAGCAQTSVHPDPLGPLADESGRTDRWGFRGPSQCTQLTNTLRSNARRKSGANTWTAKSLPMAGESGEHGDITVNLVIALGNQLKGTPCRARTKDTKVRSGPSPRGHQNTSGLYSYPDVVVVCGEPEYHDAFTDVILNPTVILEVLSPSTEGLRPRREIQPIPVLEPDAARLRADLSKPSPNRALSPAGGSQLVLHTPHRPGSPLCHPFHSRDPAVGGRVRPHRICRNLNYRPARGRSSEVPIDRG